MDRLHRPLAPLPPAPALRVRVRRRRALLLASSDSDAEAAPGDGEDRISRLSDTLLADIIHRLPTKDARRTAVLSTHWRRVWAATPLLVDDAHLGDGDIAIPRTRAPSAARASPASPSTSTSTRSVVWSRRSPTSMSGTSSSLPLPDDILRCASLDRLYLGVWHIPKTTAAARPPAFPNLRELGLFHCIVPDREFDAMLAHCPKLEVLSVVISYKYNDPSRLHLASRSLQIAVDWMSRLQEVLGHPGCL